MLTQCLRSCWLMTMLTRFQRSRWLCWHHVSVVNNYTDTLFALISAKNKKICETVIACFYGPRWSVKILWHCPFKLRFFNRSKSRIERQLKVLFDPIICIKIFLFRYICEKLCVDLSDAIMVGDTPADTIMGQSANLGLTIGRHHGSRHHHGADSQPGAHHTVGRHHGSRHHYGADSQIGAHHR